jgi:hypothetical protein
VVKNKCVRLGRYFSAVVITAVFALMTAIPAFSIYYPNSYPSYIPFVGGKYIEVDTSLGVGSIIISSSVPDKYLSVGSANSYIYNTSSSSISGVFRLRNGTDYSLRFPAFDVAQYYTAGSYNPTYNTLTINQILNTNVEFQDFSGRDKQNDTFTFSNNRERFDSVCGVLSCITSFIILIFIVWRLRND